jgi:hypothetical protein
MRALLERGATLEAATSKGCRAVHMAAMKGCAPALRELASMGADLNAADLRGYTPLHWAAVKGHAAALEVRGWVSVVWGRWWSMRWKGRLLQCVLCLGQWHYCISRSGFGSEPTSARPA